MLSMSEKMNTLETYMKLQQEIVSVNTAAFEEYRRKHTGQDIVVVGAGPTLQYYEPIEGALHIGVNRVYKDNKLKLDYYFAQDFKNRNIEFIQDMAEVQCKVFLGILALAPPAIMDAPESLVARIGATRYFLETSPSESIYQDIRYHPLADFYTVIFPAIQFALYTNPKKLYLVGCDTSYSGYFSGEQQTESNLERRHHMNHRFIGYQKLRAFAAFHYPETEIVSINPVNLRGLFRDVYTENYSNSPDFQAQQKSLFMSEDVSESVIAEFVDGQIASISQEAVE